VRFIIKTVCALIVGTAVAMRFGHMFGFFALLLVMMIPVGRA